MRCLAAFLMVIAASTLSGSAAGQRLPAKAETIAWQILRDHSASCQLAVPGEWKQVPGFGLASDPVSHATVAINADYQHGWSELGERARRTLAQVRVLDQSADRYFYEFGGAGLHYYVARRFARFSCVAQLDVWEPTAANRLRTVANQITASLNGNR